jgi:hypothetical protein
MMRILIFFILTIIFANAVNYDEDEQCCRQYGQVRDTSKPSKVTEEILYFGTAYSDTVGTYTQYLTEHVTPLKEKYNSVRFCKEVGLVAINDVQYEFTGASDWVQLDENYAIYRREDLKVYTRDINYSCKCNQEDIPIESPAPNNLGTWKIFGTENCKGSNINMEAYNALTVPHEQTTGRINCCSEVAYWYLESNKTKYDCPSELGAEWTDSDDETAEECNTLIPDFATSVSFLTSDTKLPTCCFIPRDYQEPTPTPEGNSTDNNDTPPTDNNDTPPTDNNDTPPTDNNDTPPTDNDTPPPTDSNDRKIAEDIKALDGNNQARHEETKESLNEIKSEVNASSVLEHSDLEEIKGILRGEENNNSGSNLDGIGKSYSDILNNGYSTITQKFNSLVSYRFGSVPVLKYSSQSCMFTITISFGTYTIDLNEYILLIKRYTNLMFSLLFVFVSLKMWYKSFKIILGVL